MAAGVSLKASEVPAFARRFVTALEELYPSGLPDATLDISAWLQPADLNEGLLEELDRLHPFGQGNAEPIFGLKGVVLKDSPHCFGEGNFRFRLPTGVGQSIAGIAWRMDTAPDAGQAIDLAIRFGWNFWRNSRYPQATVVDWKYTN